MPPPPTPTMTLRQLNRATLARQMLLAREHTTTLDAIERLVGLQAQWPKPPFIGLWARLEGFRREDLTALVQSHEAVRGTLMRGTLHLASARDYVRFRPVIQPVLTRGMESILRDRAKGVDTDKLVANARAYLKKEPRTFEEVRDHLMSLYPKGDERALGFIVRMLLPLIQVPTGAAWGYPSNADFALADAWIGKPVATSATSAQALVLRYLAALGPASVADIQAWSGLQGLRADVDALKPKLLTLRDEQGRELVDLPDAPRPAEDTPAPVRLLPEYDNLIVARVDARFVPKPYRTRVFLSALRVRATILVDGFVAGAWSVETKRGTATLVIEPFSALKKKTRDEITQEANGLVRFIEPEAKRFDVRIEKPSPIPEE